MNKNFRKIDKDGNGPFYPATGSFQKKSPKILVISKYKSGYILNLFLKFLFY